MEEPIQEPIQEPNTNEDTSQVVSQEEEYNRLKENNKKIREELIESEKLKSESLLAGTTGGNIVNKELSQEEQKVKGAKEFFKGTALEDAIVKANG